jgi:eukaryotic-like serine/threonine-protein kinase
MEIGAIRLVLQACYDLPGDSDSWLLDAAIAQRTRLGVSEVRHCIESLDDQGFVRSARLTEGLSAQITAEGRLFLSQRRHFSEETRAERAEPSRIRIVRRGLRSFVAEDKDFFLELLPDHRATDGLPESVHFWKTRIEETHADRTFRIGLIHGPSGCGKSSLIRAGLIPNLAAHVRSVYVESTPDDTEAGLLREMRNKCPELGNIRTLTKFLSALRKGQAIPAGQKVLIVLDQFEQWLHAKSGIENTELVDAVGQCDGGHVQTIVLVREDFWTATTRFSTQTRVKFDRDSNSYFVDLFQQPHGEKVLTAFGQACGRVEHPVTPDQKEFIELAARTLALNGMILPVRLALFFLVFQGREWTTQTLKDIGGVENIEVEFFKKIFDFGYSERRYRDHREAAQSVLRALLPESGSEIKRPISWRELLDVSGYSSRPERFTELLHLLDKDLFLITPTEQEKGLKADGGPAIGASARFYQLTHDFLVPSLREWLNKDQEAKQLVEAIVLAETKNVPQQVEKLEGLRLRTWANPLLDGVIANSGENSKERLHASLALLPVDDGQVEYLYSRLLDAGPAELQVIRDALHPFQDRLIERLWHQLDESAYTDHTLQAAGALALYDPTARCWENCSGKVARAIVTVNPAHLGFWLDALRSVRDKLTTPLATIFQDRERSATERNLASSLLEDYASDQPDLLADLVMESEEDHFSALLKKMEAHRETALPLLKEEMAKPLPEANEVEKDVMASRQARAAVALVRLGQAAEVWPKLRHSPDPRLRSFLVNWLAPLGVNPQEIVSALDQIEPVANPTPGPGQQAMDAILFHPETSMRRALILALGTYGTKRLSPGERERLTARLLDLYRSDSDAGVHGAAEWTLRRWKQEEKLTALDAELSKLKDRGDRRWYVNGQGQTFAVIDGPIEFQMGSPETDPGHPELLHQRVIPRRFAVATKEVTVEQYQEFLAQNPKIERLGIDRYIPDPTGPRTRMTWYDATAYCNWLSEKEKLPKGQLCYEPSKGEYVEGMAIPRDVLERQGYRLPTEAEWEYACRAGALTSRSYGHSTDLLAKYARYSANSEEHAWPCGSLLPNDLGLFDMLGNVYEWCQEAYEDYRPDEKGRLTDIISNLVYVIEKKPRLLRGGAFASRPAFIRSAFRGKGDPSNRDDTWGFRPARTVP